MIKSKVASILLAGALFTGGVLTALSWTGGTSLQEAQGIVTNFNNKAVEYINKAKELEQLAKDQNTDITLLIAKIRGLNSIKADLEAEVKRLEALVNEGAGNGAEVQRLQEELTKANEELTKANAEAEAHKETINNILDASIFETITVPERIDIADIVGDSSAEEAPALKYNYNIDVTTNLQSSQQAEGKAQAESVAIPFIEGINFTAEEQALITDVKITVRYSSNAFKYSVVIYTNSSDNQVKIDNKLNKYRSDANTKGMTLTASIK